MTDPATIAQQVRRNKRGRPSRRFRRLLTVAVAFAVGSAVLSACGSGDADAGTGGKPVVIAGTPLSTTDIVMTMALEGGVPERHDVALEFERVRTVSVLYQDFTAGRYDCILTDPAVFAEQAARGLPVTVLAAVSPNFAYLVARKDSGIDDPGDLVGKRLVAATATGGYKMFAAVASKWYGVDVNTQVEVVQAASDIDGLAQISTGSADAMFTFETSVTNSVMSDPAIDVVYDHGKDYKERTGETLWENVLMCRTDHDLDADRMRRVVDVLADVTTNITADPAAADAFAVEKLGAEKGVYENSFSSGRLGFAVAALDDANKKEMLNVTTFQQSAGTMEQFEVPETYFGGL